MKRLNMRKELSFYCSVFSFVVSGTLAASLSLSSCGNSKSERPQVSNDSKAKIERPQISNDAIAKIEEPKESNYVGAKIEELKTSDAVSIGNTGDFIEGYAYQLFSNLPITEKTISGNYSHFGGGDFFIEYIISFNGGLFQITKKEEGIDLSGKTKTTYKALKILNIKDNRITTNDGLFIFVKYSKNDLLDFNGKQVKEGFIIITRAKDFSGTEFIWKQ
jgi:hypothetical protein